MKRAVFSFNTEVALSKLGSRFSADKIEKELGKSLPEGWVVEISSEIKCGASDIENRNLVGKSLPCK
jgi:hypothetical protein